tara:strand:+ start:552 stop:743 length:192 start_codon:yes stop_codon:yes gene_type:complete
MGYSMRQKQVSNFCSRKHWQETKLILVALQEFDKTKIDTEAIIMWKPSRAFFDEIVASTPFPA